MSDIPWKLIMNANKYCVKLGDFIFTIENIKVFVAFILEIAGMSYIYIYIYIYIKIIKKKFL